MALAITIHEHGGPEVFRSEEITVKKPAAHEVRLQQSAIGLNYIDVYNRMGLYPMPLPGIIGMEGAGIVTDIGEDVQNFKIGDHVAYASAPLGAYASERNMPASRVVKLPAFLDDRSAAGFMVKGMTAEYLVRRTYPVKQNDVVLIHAAAGGVGLILCQWAKYLGATVIATAGSDDKCTLARDHGADLAINYKTENFKTSVKDFTDGKGVHVVYDGVGAQTFMDSLDCLRPLGMMVSFGNASGPVPAIEPKILASKGSLFLTRPSLWHYTMSEEDYQGSAKALFDVIESGAVRLKSSKTYPLIEAGQAHRDLEARLTTGSTILIP